MADQGLAGAAPICADLAHPAADGEGDPASTCADVGPEAGALTLLDSDGAPIALARVSLRDADDRYLCHRRTNARGVADFSGYDGPAAASRFQVTYHGAMLTTAVGSYETGAVVQTQEYFLCLLASDGNPVRGAWVSLKTARDKYVEFARTDVEGRVSFQILPGVRMKLEVTHGRARRRSQADPACADAAPGEGLAVAHGWTDADGVASLDVLPAALTKMEIWCSDRTHATVASPAAEPKPLGPEQGDCVRGPHPASASWRPGKRH